MARNGRGGARALPQGAASGTRTDLNARQAVRVPTGQVYGAATAMAEAQRAMPLPQADVLPTPGPTGAPPATPPTAPGAPPAAAPTDVALPPPLIGPSRRPDEPVTAPLSTPIPTPDVTLAMKLRQAAQAANSPSLAALADRAQALGQ